MTTDVVPFLVRMDTDLHDAVATTAKREDRSMASVVREALRQYVTEQQEGM